MPTFLRGPYTEAIISGHAMHGTLDKPYRRTNRQRWLEKFGRPQSGWGDHDTLRYCGRCGGLWRKSHEDPKRCYQCFAPRHESVLIMADAIDITLPYHRPLEFFDGASKYGYTDFRVPLEIDPEVEDWCDEHNWAGRDQLGLAHIFMGLAIHREMVEKENGEWPAKIKYRKRTYHHVGDGIYGRKKDL